MFENGIRHGCGEERDADGNMFVGNWENGKKHGDIKVTESIKEKSRATHRRNKSEQV